MDEAKATTGKPTFLNVRTIIGHSSQKQNTGSAHGAALGDDDVAHVKRTLGFNPDEKFVIPSKVYDYFAECRPKGAKAEAKWNQTMKTYAARFPTEYKELQTRLAGKFADDDWQSRLPSKKDLPTAAQPTRKSSGIAVQALVPTYNSFVAGSADLLESTFVGFKGQVEFQKVSRDRAQGLLLVG
jgi:dihydroxyacetone synthase